MITAVLYVGAAAAVRARGGQSRFLPPVVPALLSQRPSTRSALATAEFSRLFTQPERWSAVRR
jgi:hypothetical protein